MLGLVDQLAVEKIVLDGHRGQIDRGFEDRFLVGFNRGRVGRAGIAL